MNRLYRPITELREFIFPHPGTRGESRLRCLRVDACGHRALRARTGQCLVARIRLSANRFLSTQFASRLSLIAFATAAVRGLFSQADFYGTIQTALVALGVFYVLGLVIGEAADASSRRTPRPTWSSDSARPRSPGPPSHRPERMTFHHGGSHGNTGHGRYCRCSGRPIRRINPIKSCAIF